MSSRSILLALLALIALGAVAYFAFFTPVDVPPAPLPGAARSGESEHERRDLIVARQDAAASEGAGQAGKPEAAVADPAGDARAENVPLTAPSRANDSAGGPRRPESVRMQIVRWHRAAANDVVRQILRETGLRLETSAEAQKVLDRARVTLELENRSAAYVLEMVLLPHSLEFTVDGDRLLIFVEDE